MSAPLVIAAHGSRDPDLARVVSSLAAQVGACRPGLDVRVGYLGHNEPTLADAVLVGRPSATAGLSAVVVPLLLTRGYHVTTDIPGQAPGCLVTSAVGPDRRLAAVLAERLRQHGWLDGPVVLAAAGSHEPQASADVHTVAGWLAELIRAPVTAGFVGAGEPRLHAAGTVASYLLADGYFAGVIRDRGDRVTPPLGDDPVLAEIIVDRYDAATEAAHNRDA